MSYFALLISFVLWSQPEAHLQNRQEVPPVPVQIEVVADSLNVIHAKVMVEPNTPAREVMGRLFQMKYASWRKAFVVGIAGFEADKRKRQYWALSINGDYANVGIAEIRIKKATTIRWELKQY